MSTCSFLVFFFLIFISWVDVGGPLLMTTYSSHQRYSSSLKKNIKKKKKKKVGIGGG